VDALLLRGVAFARRCFCAALLRLPLSVSSDSEAETGDFRGPAEMFIRGSFLERVWLGMKLTTQ
jgi:hypothetical protein